MSQRRVFAEILIDEDVEKSVCEEKGAEDCGTIDYLKNEFGWMEQSGVSLSRSMIADEDDDSYYARYLGYLIDWALEQPTDHYEGKEPMTYRQWLSENKQNPIELRKKIVFDSPAILTATLVFSLRNGPVNDNGDRTSGYFNIATAYGKKGFVKANLTEEAFDLPEFDRGYAVHIINDIDGTDCKTFRTESLDENELEKLFEKILNDLQEGRL